ncbi:MAG TPA: leucyl aminopeptidase [Candidatus Magasanikbacteria bacterium]|nr:leucyl aminopeptidase [Candidatus Magasanikbacteria bacterium]
MLMIRYNTSKQCHGTDCLIIPVFEGQKFKGSHFYGVTLDRSIEQLVEGDITGKKMEVCMMHATHSTVRKVLFVGFGKEKDLTLKRYKETIGTAVVYAQDRKNQKISIALPLEVMKKWDMKTLGKETAVAVEVASYAYDEHKTDEDARVLPITHVEYILDVKSGEKKKFELGLEVGRVVGQGINLARHLGNHPPSIMTPTYLAREARLHTKKLKALNVKILSKQDLEKMGMGLLLGVARGSAEEPKFIIIEYRGSQKPTEKPTVLVGKGVTYDSGGLSLKPRDFLIDMKYDMLGAAAVLSTMYVVATLKLKRNVVALIPAVENMPSGSAFRPDDILKALNGKTVEIKNTDAEGRLILADALCYAMKYNPKEVIDLATLTGGCMIAVGLERSGLFSSEKNMVESLLRSSEACGEQLWQLPLGEEFDEVNKSEIADIRNSAGTNADRFGQASIGASFLEFFTKDKKGNPLYPWAHIDLAGAIYSGKGKAWMRAGANGFGVQILVEYLDRKYIWE